MALFSARSTVAQVMSDFSEKVADLRAVAKSQSAEAVRQEQIIADATSARDAANAEADLANATASRLEAAYMPTQSV